MNRKINLNVSAENKTEEGLVKTLDKLRASTEVKDIFEKAKEIATKVGTMKFNQRNPSISYWCI